MTKGNGKMFRANFCTVYQGEYITKYKSNYEQNNTNKFLVIHFF